MPRPADPPARLPAGPLARPFAPARALLLFAALLRPAAAAAAPAPDCGAVLGLPADAALPAAAATADRRALSEAAACWYEVGRYDRAREALRAADGGAEPVHQALYVILLAVGGEHGPAAEALARARERWPRDRALLRADLVRRVAAGDAGAWAELDAALADRPDDPQLRLAAAEMTALAPDAASARARAVVGREEGLAARLNSAALRLDAGDAPACLELLRAAAAQGRGLVPYETLRHRCAVMAADLEAAGEALLALGPAQAAAQLPAGAIIEHARLLGLAGQGKSGARLLELARSATADEAVARDSLQLRLLREAGDLDGALAVARRGLASPQSRANLARALVAAGRSADAKALVEPACAEMKGAEGRECLAWARSL